jgi:hypothetical protein
VSASASVASRNRSANGSDSTHWRSGFCGSTSSARSAAVSVIRRAPQLGQKPRRLQLNAKWPTGFAMLRTAEASETDKSRLSHSTRLRKTRSERLHLDETIFICFISDYEITSSRVTSYSCRRRFRRDRGLRMKRVDDIPCSARSRSWPG